MKKILVPLVVLSCILVYPISIAETIGDSGPELESYIYNGFQISTFNIYIENTGDATAHNVQIINATVEGNIFFNFQQTKLRSYDIEPGRAERISTNSMVFGFGNFTLSITVCCDEGATTTSSVVGLICGPFMLIP